MADRSSRDGGGGLGWFVIGLLIGVAGTLATQRFAVFKSVVAAPDAASVALQPPPPPAVIAGPPKLLVHQGGLSQAPLPDDGPIVNQEPVATGETQADVADDAAATGMTARSRPQKPPAN